MKVFHRQLLLSLLFFGVLFGCTAYFATRGIHSSVSNLTEESTLLLAAHLQSFFSANINSSALTGKLLPAEESQLRDVLFKETVRFKILEDLYLVNGENELIFALNAKPASRVFIPPTKSSASDLLQNPRLRKIKGVGAFEYLWKLDPQRNLYAVLRVRAEAGTLRPILHDFNLKLYLIGFAGLLGVVLLSLLGSRVSKSPLHQISRAMDTIDKRRYGFRLKWNKEDEFADLYQKVNGALQRLEQLDQAQRAAVQRRNFALNELRTISRFLDIMSHEIRNPLHSLGINLDVLKTKIDKGQPKDSTLKHVQTLESQLEHLQEVVQGFLSYVRPGVPKKEKSTVNDIVKQVCEMAGPEAEKSKIRIETRLGKNLHDVVLDRSQVQQALHNVVINAIHATGEDGRISIRSWEKRDKVLISVKDTGAGIPKEQLKKIFDLYYTTKKNGTGLGLPVSKRIVEANSGQLQLESSAGKGTTVTFMFPAM
jgi:signal transduction histidine kinase